MPVAGNRFLMIRHNSRRAAFNRFPLRRAGNRLQDAVKFSLGVSVRALTLNAFGIDTDADAMNRNTKKRNQP